MNECPVYREAVDAKPWHGGSATHAGLVFDKFPDAWDLRAREFDKAHEKNRDAGGASESWLARFAQRVPGDREVLKEACDRQAGLIAAQGGEIIYLKNLTRFVTGMGREHPLENGFTWHHTLGVPYLPGTGVKGVLRAWLRDQDDQRDEKGRLVDSQRVTDLLGSQESASRVTFLDMLPTAPPRLAVEIMTPHYGPYYQEKETPGDWHSPVPISYLAVDAGARWQVGILPAPGQRAIKEDEVAPLKSALLEALDWLGAGAKTATGYGQFEEDAQAAARQEELSKLPPDLRSLSSRAEKEQWFKSSKELFAGLKKLKDENHQPTQAEIEWIRETFFQAKYPELWEHPNSKPQKKIVSWLKGEE